MWLFKHINIASILEFLGVQTLAIISFITMNTAVGIFTIVSAISTALLNYYRWRKESGRITPKQKKPE